MPSVNVQIPKLIFCCSPVRPVGSATCPQIIKAEPIVQSPNVTRHTLHVIFCQKRNGCVIAQHTNIYLTGLTIGKMLNMK